MKFREYLYNIRVTYDGKFLLNYSSNFRQFTNLNKMNLSVVWYYVQHSLCLVSVKLTNFS